MKRFSNYIVTLYLLSTTVPLVLLLLLVSYLKYQEQQQLHTDRIKEAINLHKKSATQAIYANDRAMGKAVVNNLSAIDYVASATLFSTYSQDIFARTRLDSNVESSSGMALDLMVDGEHIGTLSIQRTDALFLQDAVSSNVLYVLSALGVIILASIVFSRAIIRALKQPFYEAQRYGYLSIKGHTAPTPRLHLFEEFSQLFASMDRLQDRMLDSLNTAKAARNQYQTTYNLTQVCLFVINTQDKTVTRANQKFINVFGSCEVVNAVGNKQKREQLLCLIASNEFKSGDTLKIDLNTKSRYYKINKVDISHHSIECSGLEVTRLVNTQKRLEKKVLLDPLTGAYNRTGFRQKISELAKRPESNSTVLMIDLNGFKSINDTYGHAAGDHTLCHVASRLKTAAGDSASVYRLGGDEFVLVSESLVNKKQIQQLAINIANCIEKPTNFKGTALNVSASIGIVYQQSAAQIKDSTTLADKAMYYAKYHQFRFVFADELPSA
ncbi:GGDEF domain-containing protein [Vibrio paucivorans]